MSDQLRDRAIVVTGAAGGIGSAAAVQLSSRGADVALLDRNSDGLELVAAECASHGVDVVSLSVDQTDRRAVDAAVATVIERYGRVDGLFANAGYGQFATFLGTTERNWQRHVDVNLTGTFHVCQAVAQAMVAARRGGSIVVNASSGAEVYSDQLPAYCTTKAAVRMLAIAMAAELGVHRIRVNSILPGVIESAMTGPMLGGEQAHRDVLISETPVGRLGQPADVANLVAFLLSEEAAFITGAGVRIDGGQTIHGHPRWFRLDYREAYTENWQVPT